MKKYRLLAGCLALAVFGAGCGQTGTEENKRSSEQSAPVREESLDQEEASDQTEEAATETEGETVTRGALPEELAEIPQDYFSQSDQQGTLVELEYDTYESMTYEEQEQVLYKRAIVYLPYGYSEDTQYNVFYLMHGGWSNETTDLGTPDQPAEFKNVLDNGIADGKIQPIIVVCPTYNNESESDSSDYSLALRKDSGHEWNDFFIFAASGTEDFAYASFKNQIEAMADVSDGTFRYADNEREGNLYFLEQEGGTHSGEYAMEYFYNGLCWIWK